MSRTMTTDHTKEELIEKIEAQQMLIDELLAEKESESRLDYPWKGNSGTGTGTSVPMMWSSIL
ncbi:MAG: hypothetical protein U5K84_09625 [Alkalibacterium sp.]|nr:hypothetical protein [Alkalibacterium sp.]